MAVGSVIKDGALATVQQVLTGLANLVSPVAHIVIGTVKLGVSATKLVWFSWKIVYLTGAIVVEGVQTVHAYFTK